jgi:cation-transporting P-type ATPase E
VNHVTSANSRGIGDILRANVITPFNAVLGALFALMLVIGPPQDALFGFILLANMLIGVGQEFRAKHALDRLSVVAARRATVWRDGTVTTVRLSEIVTGEVIEIVAGDQVVVDGQVIGAGSLEVNEALLTGESAPIRKAIGEALLSGSFVSAGGGRYRATGVGDDTYAARLTAEGKRFNLAHSELRTGINRIITTVGVLLVPVGALLVRSQVIVSPNQHEAIRSSVAGLVTMVPEGLVLLTSAALAVAVAGLSRRGALAQELSAIEVLARANVVCVDKTGTLTDGTLRVEAILPLAANAADHGPALATIAGIQDDADMRAIAAAVGPDRWDLLADLPFSSERRLSAVQARGHGWWALGAPEALLAAGSQALERAEALSAAGARLLALVRAAGPDVTPGTCQPEALVVLREQVRPDIATVLQGLTRDGVDVIVLSGDNPATTLAVAREAGLLTSDMALDASALEPLTFGDLRGGTVVGRVDPAGKRLIVSSLQERGFTVAMVGDGVNDVLAMKQADVGVAMGSGSDAARAAAQVVLVRGGFSSLPEAIAEGRRIIANVERLATLFVTKSVYAVLIALAVALSIDPFPFLPRQMTLIGTFTVGLPAFILTLEHNTTRPRRGFLWRTLRFAIPAGILAATVTYVAFDTSRDVAGVTLDMARTTATLVLAGVGLWLLSVLMRPLTRLRAGVLVAMVSFISLIVASSPGRQFFALSVPPSVVVFAGLGLVALAGAALEIAARLSGLLQQRVSAAN